ncbi:MAG: Ppx/GppA family phosphatase [Nitrospinae bacterium]|nr:Ppx/GppA family phosphatase [Nitrospinota bacterium]
MPAIAGIDIGSNAMRLIVANVDQKKGPDVVERAREPVRLGQDVFSQGSISEKLADQAIKALERFKGVMNRYGVVVSKVVATSALREATNRVQFVGAVGKKVGMEINVIGGAEEARLVHLAVKDKVKLGQKLALLVDVGGGSVELTLAKNGRMISTAGFDLGSVRLLCALKGKKQDEREFGQMVQEYVGGLKKDLKKEIGSQKIDVCAGTGGNIESLGELCRETLGADKNDVVSVENLGALVKKLQATSYEDRIRGMGLRPDRADVILPAAIVLLRIAKLAEVDEILVPCVGVREGLLLDIWAGLYAGGDGTALEQALDSARHMGRKYSYDEAHGETVLKLSGALFDATKELHKLGPEHRVLLEVAAILHDVGSFIGVSRHHKHTFYLLSNTPIVGLDRNQQAIVANVARYHRMATPNVRHEGYADLQPKSRMITLKLAALLRLADAMDTEHDGLVTGFTLDLSKTKAVLRLRGNGDMLIEKWKLAKKCDLFEEFYQLKLVIE